MKPATKFTSGISDANACSKKAPRILGSNLLPVGSSVYGTVGDASECGSCGTMRLLEIFFKTTGSRAMDSGNAVQAGCSARSS